MGSGCLAPKPLDGDLPKQLIQQIHQDSLGTVFKQQNYIDSENSYENTKQKIFKKSALRKLVDYLSSHRHKISQTLSQNLKICIQKGRLQTWTIGLAILERFMTMSAGANLTKKNPIDKFEYILRNKSSNFVLQQSQSFKMEAPSFSTGIQKENLTSSSGDLVLKQILSARFELILFNTIISCIAEDRLYVHGLRIVRDYTLLSAQLLKSQQKVSGLMRLLLQNVRNKFQIHASLETYGCLMIKSKDSFVLEQANTMKDLIRLWLEYQLKIVSCKNLNKMTILQEQLRCLQLLIGKFLLSSLDGMQYKVAINLIMSLSDEYHFEFAQQFEHFYLQVLSNSDLGLHFIKGLLVEILRYGMLGGLGSTQVGLEGQIGKILGQSDNIYKNLCENRTRNNLFATIRRWVIVQKHINLQEIVKYHSSLFIYCFLLRLPEQTKNSQSEIVFKDIIFHISQQQKAVLVQTVFQEYQKQFTSRKIRYMLLNMSKLILQHVSKIAIQTNRSHFTVNCQWLNVQQSIALYQAVINFYSLFSKETLDLYTQQLCETLASIFGIFNCQEITQQRDRLLKKFMQFLELIAQVQGIVIAYYQKITKIIRKMQSRKQHSNYFDSIHKGLIMLFKKCNVSNYQETQFEQQKSTSDMFYQNEKGNNRVSSCHLYFKDILGSQGGSKYDGHSGHFQKVGSIISDRADMDQEASFRDVLQMINI